MLSATRAPMVKRPTAKRLRAITRSDRENVADALSTIGPAGILTRDPAAARRWMVSVIAARALELYSERRQRTEEQATAPDGIDNGNAHGTAEWQREERNG